MVLLQDSTRPEYCPFCHSSRTCSNWESDEPQFLPDHRLDIPLTMHLLFFECLTCGERWREPNPVPIRFSFNGELVYESTL